MSTKILNVPKTRILHFLDVLIIEHPTGFFYRKCDMFNWDYLLDEYDFPIPIVVFYLVRLRYVTVEISKNDECELYDPESGYLMISAT